MRKFFLILVVLVAAFFIVWKFVLPGKNKDNSEKPSAITVNNPAVNQGLEKVLDSYENMNEAFVAWDSSKVNKEASAMAVQLEGLDVKSLKDSNILLTAQTYIESAKSETRAIQTNPGWKEKRQSLNQLSQNLFDLLRTVQYNVEKLYYQECPMAFGEDTYGYWLSTKRAIRNPYLGTSDPEWGTKMLKCGMTKDSLDFSAR